MNWKDKMMGSRGKVYFHASPESGITRLMPRYTRSLGMKGIYLTNSQSLLRDWIGTLLHKGRSKRREPFHDIGNYNRLTVYKVFVPNDVAQRASEALENMQSGEKKRLMDEARKEKGRQLTPQEVSNITVRMYSFWNWGYQMFIPEEDMDKLQIVGSKTYESNELDKEMGRFNGKRQENNFSYDLNTWVKQLKGKHMIADIYCNILDVYQRALLQFNSAYKKATEQERKIIGSEVTLREKCNEGINKVLRELQNLIFVEEKWHGLRRQLRPLTSADKSKAIALQGQADAAMDQIKKATRMLDNEF